MPTTLGGEPGEAALLALALADTVTVAPEFVSTGRVGSYHSLNIPAWLVVVLAPVAELVADVDEDDALAYFTWDTSSVPVR